MYVRVTKKAELEAIRTKVEKRQIDYTKTELDCLKAVYDDIQKQIGSKMRLNTSCSSCVVSGMNIVHNYIKFHELPEAPVSAKAKVTKVVISSGEVNLDEGLSLKELRAKYPGIKSNSVEGFLKKLEDGNN